MEQNLPSNNRLQAESLPTTKTIRKINDSETGNSNNKQSNIATTGSLNESETEPLLNSAFESLSARLSRLEHQESSRSSIEISLNTLLSLLQNKENSRSNVEDNILLENSRLRKCIEILQCRISELESTNDNNNPPRNLEMEEIMKETESVRVKAVDDESQLRAEVTFLHRKISRLEKIFASSDRNEGLSDNSDKKRGIFSDAASIPPLQISPTPGDDDKEKDDFGKSLEKTLPNDTFSFIVVGRLMSIPFVLAITVVAFQLMTFLLAGYNVIRPGGTVDDLNPFQFPVNVDSAVRTAQIIAIVVAIITQDDIRTGLNMLLEGYNKESLEKEFPHVAGWKWMLSITTRLLEGGVGLMVTWLLIMTAETVVDLLLNFTAMEFVSQLDDVCYFMSQEGFFGKTNARNAIKINNTNYFMTRQASYLHRCILLAIMFIGLFSGWFAVARNQTNGKYLCTTVFVQFSDEFIVLLGPFSGLYDKRTISSGIFSAQRVEYVDRQTGTAVFSYCTTLRAWTFNFNKRGVIDPCEWVVRSPQTETFDLTETASFDWVARSETRIVSLERFFLVCYDCEHNNNHRCGGHGCCRDAVCECDDGWYGIRCEFREPCPTIQFDQRLNPFEGDHEWSKTFNRLEVNNEYVDAYFRPIYVAEYAPGLYDLIIFSGRRWGATYSGIVQFVPLGNMTVLETLAKLIPEVFHPGLNSFPLSFVSAPVDVGTADDKNSPEGIEWYSFTSQFVRTSELAKDGELVVTAIDSVLICAECDDVFNKCMYDGKCVDGACDCADGAEGALCQIPPIGNGHCDPFYNKRTFEYDGGDCCEFTCVSTDDFTCGIDESGFVSLGYSDCHLGEDDGWNLSGKPITGGTASASGYSVGLSSNGGILIVCEPMADQLRLFDKVGSIWTQRGPTIQGESLSFFGMSLAIASSSMHMFPNPINAVPITFAVGTGFSSTGSIHVYECEQTGCSQVGSDLVAFEDDHKLAVNIDVSSNGSILAAGAMAFASPEFFPFGVYPLAIYDKGVLGTWVKRDLDLVFQDSESVYSVKLSGSGSILAIGSFLRSFSLQRGIFLRKDTKRVYEWNGSSWRQRGSAIIDMNPHPAMLVNMQGRSLALSDDGNVLAVGFWKMTNDDGSKQVTRILTWDKVRSNWVQRGAPIVCGDHELQGWSIALSSDGLAIAIGSADYNGANSIVPSVGLNGTVCNFRWNGRGYEPVGRPLPGGHISCVALSGDGSAVAIGLAQQTLDITGSTSVYKLPGNSCRNSESQLRLSLTTDTNPPSTYWNMVLNETGEVIMSDGPYEVGLQFMLSYAYEACVPQDSCVIFSIYDNLDLNQPQVYDGMFPPGMHTIFLDGEQVAEGRLSGAVERITIGEDCRKCPSGTALFSMMVQTCAPVAWELIDSSSGATIFSDNNFEKYIFQWDNDCSFSNQTTYWEEVCVSLEACASFSIFPLDFVPSGLQSSLPVRNLQYRLFLDTKQVAEDTMFVSLGGTQSVASHSVGECTSR